MSTDESTISKQFYKVNQGPQLSNYCAVAGMSAGFLRPFEVAVAYVGVQASDFGPIVPKLDIFFFWWSICTLCTISALHNGSL
jgi:hypothetical protein